MTLLSTIDGLLTTVIQTYFLLLGIYGVYRAIRGYALDGSYTAALLIGEGLFILSLLFDLILWIGDIRPERAGLHYLYAIFATLLMPFIYTSVIRGEESNASQWIFSFVSLFLWLLVDRLVVII